MHGAVQDMWRRPRRFLALDTAAVMRRATGAAVIWRWLIREGRIRDWIWELEAAWHCENAPRWWFCRGCNGSSQA